MSLPEEIARFGRDIQQIIKEAPKKTTTTSPKKARPHKHFTACDRGYAPRTTDRPVNIRKAKRRCA